MDIVIIGDGKVGHKLAMQLSGENYNVTLIDQCEKKLSDTVNEMDVSCVAGDGGSAEVQRKADVPGADLVIACTSTDEMNLFCCLLARRLGAKQTIARVRNPVYAEQMHLLKEDLKLSMAVNPELALAGEISRDFSVRRQNRDFCKRPGRAGGGDAERKKRDCRSTFKRAL